MNDLWWLTFKWGCLGAAVLGPLYATGFVLYLLYGAIFDAGYRKGWKDGWKDAHDIIAEERRVLKKARGEE